MTHDNPCDRCPALCCQYFSLEIDAPETPEDYDNVRWYLMHDLVHVFVEDECWYLSILTPCRNLTEDHRCGVYEDRPRICEQYSNTACDFVAGDTGYDHYFQGPEQLERHAQMTLGRAWTRYVTRQRQRNTESMNPADARSHTKPAEILRARLRPPLRPMSAATTAAPHTVSLTIDPNLRSSPS